jgi:hypothetical protein
MNPKVLPSLDLHSPDPFEKVTPVPTVAMDEAQNVCWQTLISAYQLVHLLVLT